MAALLAACGGGGGGGASAPTTDPALPADMAWGTPPPSDAAEVSEAALRAALVSGEATLAPPPAKVRQEQERRWQESQDTLSRAAAQQPALAQALAAFRAAPDPFSNNEIKLSQDGPPVVLLSAADGARQLAQAVRDTNDVVQQRALYAQLLPLATADGRATLPTAAQLAAAELSTVRDALAALNTQLAALPRASVLRTRGDRASVAQSLGTDASSLSASADLRRHRLEVPTGGSGRDSELTCLAPLGLYRQHWFPLRQFQNQIRNQGQRGTCWAFSAVGAMEMRDRVVFGETTNLSEQFFVHRVRGHWFMSDGVESGSDVDTLNAAVSNSQVLAPETYWTYNSSAGRLRMDSFKGVCTGYGGTCAENAHQGPQIRNGSHVANRNYTYSGPGRIPTRATTVWNKGDAGNTSLPMGLLTATLDSGIPVLASFPVHVGFDQVTTDPTSADLGVLTDVKEEMIDPATNQRIPGSRGTHLVLIVGFLSNDQLSRPGRPADVPGGGYFIVRNSWGCGWGDGGYAYLSAQYVKKVFHTLSIPAFESARSAEWQAEQRLPGGRAPLEIERDFAAARNVLWNVPTDLAALFKVRHPVARSVQLKVTSDLDGVLFDGPWALDADLVPASLIKRFITLDLRLITIRASYGGQVVTRDIPVQPVNAQPRLELLAPATVRAGEATTFTALPSDPNTPDTTALCSNTAWRVEAPDRTLTGNGCTQQVIFSAAGTRLLEATVTDAQGLSVTRQLQVQVLPAAANPFPRITTGTVFSRQFIGAANLRICGTVDVTPGSTIDLRGIGCGFLTGSSPPRYGASVTVENPGNETLGYRWVLWVTTSLGEERLYEAPLQTTDPVVALTQNGNANPVTRNCRVEATVVAPEASRNRSQPIWNGRCTYFESRLN